MIPSRGQWRGMGGGRGAPRRLALLFLLLLFFLASPGGRAWARPTSTLPKKMFMLDVAYAYSLVTNAYDNQGKKVPLLAPMHRYEPGGGLQGIIIPNARVTFHMLIPQIRYGILDYLTAAVGVPVVLQTRIDPRMGWVSGDYYWTLGRSYTEEDFWQWAASMGQPKPGTWVGNKGVLSDIVLGMRYRFSAHLPRVERAGFGMALTAYYALPTGRQKDPEEIASAGTTSWELNFQGEVGFHLTVDKSFRSLRDRLTIGLDLFYEVFLPHRYRAGVGTKNPLIQTQAPYVGKTYLVDPGDFMGFGVYLEGVVWVGPTTQNWLTRKRRDGGAGLPPMLTLSVGYVFTYLGQTDYRSDSALWDWSQEKPWRPGYKNRLVFDLQVSFLRLGAPFMVYVSYKNLTWIAGRNNRPSDVVLSGIRVPFKLF